MSDWFNSIDWEPFKQFANNENLMNLLSSPYGLGVMIVLIVISILMRWRFTFSALCFALASTFIARSLLAGEQSGPNNMILYFIAAGVAVAGFVIYFSLVADE
jgi:hypothetical protein